MDQLCVICGERMSAAFRAQVLGRHDVGYFSCPACQHLRTEAPFWLEEAYSEAIARADTGIVGRNIAIARALACILFAFFDRGGRFLDTAGGTGLLTRLLRDAGFDARWEDKYCQNVLAAGFEASADEGGFEAVSAFEALEHMPDPLSFIRAAVDRSATGTLIFTTELFEGSPPAPDWWYYAFATGQHISFFTRQTLETIARRLDLRFLSARGMHMFTRKAIPAWRYAWVVRRSRHGLYEKVLRKMTSRTQDDHEQMLRRSRP